MEIVKETKTASIFENRTFTDGQGKVVIERVLVAGEQPKDAPRFIGQGAVPVQTPHGPQPMRFDFRIVADTIEEAFEKFEEAGQQGADEAIRNMQRQNDRLQIVGPDGLPPS